MKSKAPSCSWMLLSVVLLGMMGVACGTAPAPDVSETAVDDIKASLKAFIDAWEGENLEAAAATFVPDAVVFDPVPPGRFEGMGAIRGWISGSFEALEHISINCSNVRVQTKGPVAWLTARFVFEGQQAGQPVRFEGDLTMVWLRQADGSQKLAVFHASHLPTAPAGS